MKPFDYSLDYANLDLRAHPEWYAVGRGEQGVLLVEPYKSEILPHWRFKTPEIAAASAERIYAMFLDYKTDDDFVGMDMARKFLQMGFTRARRYANHSNGRKYGTEDRNPLPDRPDAIKAESAAVFKRMWDKARQDPDYLALRQRHRERYESASD
ncbi:DUF4385 domain-containing protein [Cohnella sp. JJ-181]|uniref:DUF4385 domain-containing protein n=1 Tax=Cohnella rhizoplanae TaxID=2974897 RepID=UPI0022FF7714|nr:DUF4385 domain-containing protein [Cohnella sp. JJ-181]CAI6080621.1 hypothetical protein COHCIP112018_03045 [Cohnella sp. JJ-181]